MSPHKRKVRSFQVDGNRYSSLAQLAIAAGISYLVAVKRSHRGWSDHEIFHGRSKIVRAKKAPVPRGKPVVIASVEYKNIGHAHAAIKPSATLNAIKARVRNGWTHEQAFGLKTKVDGRSLRDKRQHGPRVKRTYSAFGKTYKSVTVLARTHGVAHHLVYDRLRKGWTAERAVTEPATKTVEINGKTYRSAMGAWREIGKTTFFVFTSRRQVGHDLETCLGLKPIRNESHVIDGVRYPSMSAVANKYDIKESVLWSRLNRMSISEAVVYNPSNGRYTTKRFKADPALARSVGYLYFVQIRFPGGSLHKVGITQRKVKARFAAHPNYREITVIEGRLGDLFLVEQSILREFRKKVYRAEDEFEGRTETFLLTADEEKAMLKAIQAKASAQKGGEVYAKA